MDCSFCSWNSPGKNIGGGSHSLHQEIFLTQGSNPGLPLVGSLLVTTNRSSRCSQLKLWSYRGCRWRGREERCGGSRVHSESPAALRARDCGQPDLSCWPWVTHQLQTPTIQQPPTVEEKERLKSLMMGWGHERKILPCRNQVEIWGWGLLPFELSQWGSRMLPIPSSIRCVHAEPSTQKAFFSTCKITHSLRLTSSLWGLSSHQAEPLTPPWRFWCAMHTCLMVTASLLHMHIYPQWVNGFLLFFFFFGHYVSIGLREGNSNPFQYSCLENSMDRGA